MNVLISGGAKNGKSMFAQSLAMDMAKEDNRKKYYVATMIPADEEDETRIKRHREERCGWGFVTLEQGRNIASLLEKDEIDRNAVFLVDSITALFTNEFFDENWNVIKGSAEKVADELARFADLTGNAIFVSDDIYGDTYEKSGKYDPVTEEFRSGLAMICRRIAGVCDKVYTLEAGIATEWK